MDFRVTWGTGARKGRGCAGRPGGLTLDADSGPGARQPRAHSPDQDGGRRARQAEADEAVAARGRGLYGALDLGTNNCRLLVADPGPGGFAVVDAFSRIVRLGEGVSASGALAAAAMERTVSALRVCANKLRWWRVARVRLIATEACRMAANPFT